MKSSEIRESFIRYFERNGHQAVASSSLVPTNDPTLMFTNAGMNQFKDCFLGSESRPYKRAVTCQKVMRISGKHNDFENVGVTARHHTFFEMLGNFSFGDYFKDEAIRFGWEFVTKELAVSPQRLWITVFEKDNEAFDLWKRVAGVPEDRIIRLGESENFWAMGETGPCGPCTEMHVFCGEKKSDETAQNLIAGNGDFLEIWNHVFMQYNRTADGKLNPLPKPSVDTGMGLERVTSVLQGVRSNYDTDLLRPIIAECETLSGFKYDGSSYAVRDLRSDLNYARDVAMRAIADHSRAMAFIIADGVMPGSEGRAYILRRIIRRAIRHGRSLNFKEPVLARTTKVVIEMMSGIYPELRENAGTIARVVDAEERKFHETLDSGLGILQREAEKLSKGQMFSGKTAFLLHDTYGFPLDLTQDALKQYGAIVDLAEFEKEMGGQRERSRENRRAQGIVFSAMQIKSAPTRFVGYETLQARGTLQQLVPAADGDPRSFSLLFDITPFYAESGGQVGDCGEVRFEDVRLRVIDTQKEQDRFYVHQCEVLEGDVSEKLVGASADLMVDQLRRDAIRANHSATHLLHSALRSILGTHVKQAGSRVDDASLRFDFSHFEPITEQQLEQIQTFINQQIRQNHAVEIRVMGREDALKSGAMALFGEKYGDQVRVVQIGPQSIELCGGTHVLRSGDIGFTLVTHESGVAAGVRRIECLTATGAEDLLALQRRERMQIAHLLKSDAAQLDQKVDRLIQRSRLLERELEALKTKLAGAASSDLAQSARTTSGGIKVICEKVDAPDTDTLKSMVDRLRVNLGSGVVALGSLSGEKAVIVAGVTSDLTARVNAGSLVKEASKNSGGKGGGRADFAQAGGVDAHLLGETLERIYSLIEAQSVA